MFTLIALITFQQIQILLLVISVRIGAAWVKVEPRTWRRCTVGALLMWVVSVIIGLLTLINPLLNHPMATAPQQLFGMLLSVGLQVGAMILVLSKLFKISVGRAAKAWLPSLGVSLLAVAIMLLLVRPFMLEAYVVPTMSMAPTLRGPWTAGTCSECQGETVISVRLYDHWSPPANSVCTLCYEAKTIDAPNSPQRSPTSADRFVANKLRTPARFDVVVFRTPDDPSVTYVKRLVGLPGETIQLTNRQLFINGQPVAPPVQAAKIRFGELPGGARMKYAVDEPFRLGPDEYFMIGDNQPFAADSRFIGPVPGANLIGVVELIYWPPTRVQVLP